jgi:hypothetical protein
MGQDSVEIPDLSLGVKLEIVFGHLKKHFDIPALPINADHILLGKRKISA